jgi:hypothetical protein
MMDDDPWARVDYETACPVPGCSTVVRSCARRAGVRRMTYKAHLNMLHPGTDMRSRSLMADAMLRGEHE